MAVCEDNGAKGRTAHARNAVLLASFERETAHDSGATAATYRGRIASSLRRYRHRYGDEPDLTELIRDAALLAQLLAADRDPATGRLVLTTALNGLRVALRSLIAWLPTADERERERLHGVLRAARDRVSEERGLRKVNVHGRAPEASPGFTPGSEEIVTVVRRLRHDGDPLSRMTADLVEICYLTGARVGALLGLTGADVVRGTDERVRVHVYEKARATRRAVFLPRVRRGLAEEWLARPPEASVWVCDGRQLNYDLALRRLRRACTVEGVEPFGFHRLRHAFASDAGAAIGLAGLQDAGGWKAPHVAEHYYRDRRH